MATECELTASPSPSMVILLFSLSELLSLRAEFGIELTKSERRPEAVGGGNAMYGMEAVTELRRRRTERGCNKNLFSFDGPKERGTERSEDGKCRMR